MLYSGYRTLFWVCWITDHWWRSLQKISLLRCARVETHGVGSVCTNIRRRARISRRQHSTGWTTVRPPSADGATTSQTRTRSVSFWRPTTANSKTKAAESKSHSSARELTVCLSELCVCMSSQRFYRRRFSAKNAHEPAKNRSVASSRQGLHRSSRSLARWRTVTLWILLADNISNFYKFKMADGRHLKNR